MKGLPSDPIGPKVEGTAARRAVRAPAAGGTVAIPEPTSTGYLDFHDWRTWYRLTGDLGSRPPVVVLHGGPGATHSYTLRMARLVEQGWPVIHYDQLGAGESTHLPDKGADFWTVELFLEELENLLAKLGIRDD